MRLKLHPMFLLFGAVYIFFGQGWLFAAYVAAVVLHECAHMAVARNRGIPTESITLYPYGGEIKLSYVNIDTLDEIRIALAGPLLNLLLAALLMGAWWAFPSCYSATQPFYVANLSTGLCNLIPVYPLDGGRVLVSLLKRRLTKYRSILIAKVAGYAVCLTLAALGLLAIFTTGNFSFLSLAFFLFLGQRDIKAKAYTNSFLDNRKRDLLAKRGLKECVVMVHRDTPIYELITLANRDYYYIFDVVGDGYRRLRRIEEPELYDLAAKQDIYAGVGQFL